MDQVVLLDTHVLLWATLEPGRLSRVARLTLSRAARRVIADISLREIAQLVQLGRVEVEEPLDGWLADALEEVRVEVVPITPAIAARSARIAPHFHGDPADQLIAATSIVLNVPLVTVDEKLRASPALRTIW